MAQIRINKLVKKFGDFHAVKDLDLTIHDGEFLTLLGPSGCGKTTTLRCIAGIERQSSGDIRIGDRVVNDLPPGDRDIAMVFQFYALYPHLTAYDNIAFPLRAQKMPVPEATERVGQAARALQIEYLLNKRPGKLGAGEQQRVALGRAMVRRPQVFLMDEPLTNLDAKLRTEMRMELKRLQRELNTTMVYVTHDQTEALSMSQRIAIMNQGVLQQVGTPLDVYNRPATLFVASFIGTPPMNFVEVELARDMASGVAGDMGQGPSFVDSSGAFRITPTAEQHNIITGLSEDGPFTFGVRSEDVSIIGLENGALQAEVYLREPLGDEIIYDLKIGDKIVRAKVPPTLRLAIGDQVGVRCDPERTHLFNRKSGQAIF
ncbi:MAG: ABC transporter ATP-binding protein [Chloroflexota bacterium]|nr:ABC transporter ATP-binding protein [Chloroflexota bacterium]